MQPVYRANHYDRTSALWSLSALHFINLVTIHEWACGTGRDPPLCGSTKELEVSLMLSGTPTSLRLLICLDL